MFSFSMFGPFRCSVFRCSVPFEVRSFDIQSFDVRSHSMFSLSMFSPIGGSVFRCSVLFDIRSFEVRSFGVQSFEVRSFEVRSFEVRSRFQAALWAILCFGVMNYTYSSRILTFSVYFVWFLWSTRGKIICNGFFLHCLTNWKKNQFHINLVDDPLNLRSLFETAGLRSALLSSGFNSLILVYGTIWFNFDMNEIDGSLQYGVLQYSFHNVV